MNKKKLISVAAAVALTVGVAGCGDQSDSGSAGSSASEEQNKDKKQQGKGDQKASSKPDLKGVPKVVAVVNGKEIPKKEFSVLYKSQLQQQTSMGGGKVNKEQLKKQTAKQLVDTELLVQGASEQGFDASRKDVDKELKKVAQQSKMKPQQFLDQIKKQQGMNEELVRDQLRDQLQVTDYVEDEAGKIQPSEKEMRKYYDKLAAQQKQAGSGGKMPKFSKVKPQLKQQMIAEEQQKVAQQLVKKLKKDANVDIKV